MINTEPSTGPRSVLMPPRMVAICARMAKCNEKAMSGDE